MRLLDNALSAGKQDMPGGGTKNNIAINTTRRTTGRIKFCFIRHVQRLTRTIKTNGSEHSDLSMDDVTQLFPQLSVGRRFTFPTYELWRGNRQARFYRPGVILLRLNVRSMGHVQPSD